MLITTTRSSRQCQHLSYNEIRPYINKEASTYTYTHRQVMRCLIYASLHQLLYPAFLTQQAKTNSLGLTNI